MRRFGLSGRAFEIGKNRQLVNQNSGSSTNRLFGLDDAIGFDVDHQTIEVGTLFDTGTLDGIGDTAYRAERSIDQDGSDGAH